MFFRQLEYFCAIARTGSYRAAAEELFVSQSAISQQVKALEAELEQTLTVRNGRSFTLTPAGKRLAHEGQRILDDTHQLQREMKSFGQAPSVLRVGYLNRYRGNEIQTALATFSLHRPEVRLSARSGSHDELAKGILDGELDILLNDRRRELSDTWENRPLFCGYDYIEVSRANPLSRRESLTVQDLANETCILIAAAEQQSVERTYYRDILSYPCEFVFADTAEQASMMVAANRGISPVELNRETTEGEATAKGTEDPRENAAVRRIPLTDASGQHRHREYYAFWLKARTNPAIVEFAQILEDLFA